MTSLKHLPVFGPEYAHCDRCELKYQCEAKKHVPAHVPENWNGIVIVGEGPGVVEVSRQRPFCGPAGNMLKALLENVGVELDDCYVTNATLCLPPRDSGDGSFMERFPGAVHACLPRLRAELEAIKPRVVLALGAAAFNALAGKESHRVRRVPTNCTRCDPKDRKIGPGLECGVAECDWFEPCAIEDGAALKAAHNNTCPKCKASIKRIKPKRVKCPDCGGLKTKEESYTTFTSDWKLSEVVGGLFPAEMLPSGLEGSVKYVIPTYHPSFLLRSTDAQSGSKKFGGQFAARAVTDHFKRARELVDRDHHFEVNVEITDDPERVREYCAGAGPFVVDIETDSEDGPYAVTCIRCVGIWDTSSATQLVVDTELCGFRHRVQDDLYHLPEHAWLLVEALEEFLSDPTRPKIGQHFLYDRVTLSVFWGIEVRGQAADTELGHQCLYPDEPHNLAHIAACMTDAEAWKPPKKKGGTLVYKDFGELAVYNARDLCVTGAAAFRMGCDLRAPRGLLDQEGVREPYEQDLQLLDVAEEMELTGLPVDPDALKAIGDAAKAEIKSALDKIAAAFVNGIPEKQRDGSVRMKKMAERCEVYPEGLPNEQAADAVALAENPDAEVQSRAAVVLRNDDRGFEPYVWRPTVPKDLLWALFDKPGFLELPVLVLTDKTRQPSTSKEALLTHIGEPSGFVQALIDFRKYQKILSTYVEGNGLELKADGRIHASWNVARAVTGRFTTSPNCFSEDTEILTKRGWVRFPALKCSDAVAQVHVDRDGGTRAEFTADWRPVTVVAHDWVHVKSTQIDLLMTGDHRCLLFDRKTNTPQVWPAVSYPEDRKQLHAVDVGPQDGALMFTWSGTVLLCATQADGTYRRGARGDLQAVEWKFTKQRKIDRLTNALREARIPYTSKTTKTGQMRINTKHEPFLRWLEEHLPTKVFRAELLLNLCPSSAKAFCDEFWYWDGCHARRSHYASSVRENADLVQALLSLNGVRARLRQYRPKNPKARTSFQVDTAWRSYSMTTNRKLVHVDDRDGADAYCVTVPSGFIMVRRNGCVAVTGNCQNWPRELRSAIVAPPGRKLVGADMSQLELRIMAALTGDPELTRRCMEADENRKLEPEWDPHSFVADLTFGSSFTQLDLNDKTHKKTKPGEPKCRCETCKRKALREVVKRTVYGFGYGASPPTVRDAIYNGGYEGPPITVAIIERVQQRFFAAFPAVNEWRNEQMRLAEENWEVRSPILRRRRIFPLGQIEFTITVNYPIQSGGADIVNQGTLRYYRGLRAIDPTARLIAQVHDALYTDCAEDKAEAVAAWKAEALSCHLSLVEGAPPMAFLASAKVGSSWKEVS